MNKISLIILACFFASCGLPNKVTEKMDIAHYNSTQVNGVAQYTQKNRGIVSQTLNADGSYIQKSIYPSYFNYPTFDGMVVYKEFYDTGELKRMGPMFYGQFYGKHKIYGKDGKMINEINFEAPYKSGLYAVRKKIKKEFGFDLLKTPAWVSRSLNPPVYNITLPVTGEPKIKRYVTIDANTCAIVSNVTR